jgi:hypothetical protein
MPFSVVKEKVENMKYEIRKVWKYGSRRHVVALPEDWAGIQYVLIGEDEEGLLVLPLADVRDDSEAAELAANLNRRLERA